MGTIGNNGGGRRKKPTAELAARGSWRANDKSRKDEPAPLEGALIRPVNLSALAGQLWDSLEYQLTNMGVLSTTDSFTLHVLCETYATWVSLTQDIKKRGRFFTDADGNRKTRPEVGLAKDAQTEYYRYMREFGLSPASRANVKTNLPKKTVKKVNSIT